MKHSLLFGPWIYPAIGMAAVLGLITIASCRAVPGTGNRLSSVSHTGIAPVLAANRVESHPSLDDEGRMPDFDGAVAWLNTPPLDGKSLRGKVVLVNFWTYSCINSLRALPYMKSWAAKYKEDGLVAIGVHTPEFPFEKESVNVGGALRDYKVTYPVALDSNYAVWQAFNNEYWPAFYFIDRKGRIRYHQFGEGDYDKSERVIQELLKEDGATGISSSIVSVSASGAEAAPDLQDAQSPETYIGYQQAERFVSSERVNHDHPRTYSPPLRLSLNEWGLEGPWNIDSRSGVLQALPGKIVFRFHSRDLHLVLGPSKDRKPIRFRVSLDGAGPGSDSGTDVTADGTGEVREYRLYQLIRQKGSVKDRTFEIEFLDPGVQAFSFTFG
jgi:thiol-disulfide isomerase/thioredoxin